MEVLWMIIIMIIIGAAIGGFTNYLAIKMLFRPYNPIMIGKFRVPFTPGLIPKRREELSIQLGDLVVKHLITKEGLQKKLTESEFRDDLVQWSQEEVARFLDSDKTIGDMGAEWFATDQLDIRITGKIRTILETRISTVFKEYEAQSIGTIIPESVNRRIDGYIPKTTHFIQTKLITFVESSEGKRQFKQLIDEFLSGRGMLGNMINMFLGNESLIDKVQDELVKILKKETVASMIERILRKEWENIKEMPIGEIAKKVKAEGMKAESIDWILKQINVKQITDKPLNQLVESYRETIVEQTTPRMVDHSLEWVAGQIEELMEKLKLSELVREQVETFSLPRLEEVVLSISSKELKMITYLGALLGGIIGLFQGMLVYFIT